MPWFVRGRRVRAPHAGQSPMLTGINVSLSLLRTAILVLSVPILARASAPKLGVVRHIDGGLQLQPPHQRVRHGKVLDGLFDAYRLGTASKQRASLGFVDGSVFHMNQKTDLVLGSLDRAVLNRGEIDAVDRHRTHQIVQTNVAIVVATGTDFDVRIERAGARSSPYPSPTPRRGTLTFPAGTTTVSVVSGTVRVSNRFGSTIVHANQWTHVPPGRAPLRPTTHRAIQDIAWARGLPPP